MASRNPGRSRGPFSPLIVSSQCSTTSCPWASAHRVTRSNWAAWDSPSWGFDCDKRVYATSLSPTRGSTPMVLQVTGQTYPVNTPCEKLDRGSRSVSVGAATSMDRPPTTVRSAGHAFLIGQSVFMRFIGHDDTVRSLIGTSTSSRTTPPFRSDPTPTAPWPMRPPSHYMPQHPDAPVAVLTSGQPPPPPKPAWSPSWADPTPEPWGNRHSGPRRPSLAGDARRCPHVRHPVPGPGPVGKHLPGQRPTRQYMVNVSAGARPSPRRRRRLATTDRLLPTGVKPGVARVSRSRQASTSRRHRFASPPAPGRS